MSSTRDWITPCLEYAFRLTDEPWRQIEQECSRSGVVETGGILVGHYTNDQSMALVTEALPPPNDSTWGANWFHRGVAGLRGLLAKRWENDFRTYYIGEWHYHPACIIEPSPDDLNQMYGINSDARFCCREPVMMIVGKAVNGGERPIRIFLFPHGTNLIELQPSPKLAPS